MAKKKIKELILFLKSFRQQLLALSRRWNTKELAERTIDNIEAFKMAEGEERDVIFKMVRPDPKLDTGQDSFGSMVDSNHSSERTMETNIGYSKKKTSSHFNSNDEAA